ncbi:excisionase family DNA-binding protein [Ruminiclostridium cellobioparum]|uniref:excisionase family DNA-binding protein n=1 Tax=Ruminiclostridium cellobioparum TaxID=29355 RepID=UPI0028A81502|nr:excisionase family DNA-binding protein [Ruminiclostridium cellobioparum]
MMPESVTFSAKEAAAYLGISYGLLLDLKRRGQIPCIPMGNRYLFRKYALDQWMVNSELKSLQTDREDEAKPIRGIRRISE